MLAGSTAVSPDVVSVQGTQEPLCGVNSFLQECSSVGSSSGGAAHPFPTSLAELIRPNTYQVLHQACLEEGEGGKEGETDRERTQTMQLSVEHSTSMHEALMDSITRCGQNQPNSPSKSTSEARWRPARWRQEEQEFTVIFGYRVSLRPT